MQVEPGLSLGEGLDRRLEEARGHSLVDFALHMNPREANDAYLAEIPQIAARGIPSFKFFMVYDGFKVPDGFIFAAMQEVAALDGIALIHAENDAIIEELLRQNARAGRTARQHSASARPTAMEGEAVYRALAMAEVTGASTLIFHLTAAEAVREVRNARSRGQLAYGEACLAYLLLDPSALDDPVSGTALDFSPPLRPLEHREALWAGLADGTIDIVSTDHGPRRRVRGEDGTLHTPPGTAGHRGAARARPHPRRARGPAVAPPVGRPLLHAAGRAVRARPQGPPGARLRRRHRDLRSRAQPRARPRHAALEHRPLDLRGLTPRAGSPSTTISRGRVLVHDGELLTDAGDGPRPLPRARPGPPVAAAGRAARGLELGHAPPAHRRLRVRRAATSCGRGSRGGDDRSAVVVDIAAPDAAATEWFAGRRRARRVRAGGSARRGRARAVSSPETITHVVHAAIIAHVPEWEQATPRIFLDVNIGGTVNMLEWARALPALERFVYFSTGGVYGDPGPGSPTGPQPEDGPFNPPELYPISKLACEAICRRYAELFGLDLRITRLSGVFGPMERRTTGRTIMSAGHAIAAALCEGRPLRVTRAEPRGGRRLPQLRGHRRGRGPAAHGARRRAAPRHLQPRVRDVHRRCASCSTPPVSPLPPSRSRSSRRAARPTSTWIPPTASRAGTPTPSTAARADLGWGPRPLHRPDRDLPRVGRPRPERGSSSGELRQRALLPRLVGLEHVVAHLLDVQAHQLLDERPLAPHHRLADLDVRASALEGGALVEEVA